MTIGEILPLWEDPQHVQAGENEGINDRGAKIAPIRNAA
jgi:hypothetical protein